MRSRIERAGPKVKGVSDSPSARSVKIDRDERLGWSSDRPRKDGGGARPIDISGPCRVLSPADIVRYSPGSLLMVACASADLRAKFAERVISDRAAVLSLEKVRALLKGRVPADDVDAKARELLDAAVKKRLTGGQTVVITLDTLDAAEREPYLRMAHAVRRPRHVILLETPRSEVADDDVAAVNELRQAVDTAGLGAEGVQTAMRLGGGAIHALKRILFRKPDRDE